MSKKLTQAALKKACSRHNWALQWCWNYEKMEEGGQPEVHDSLKVALMGPLAGIGDTIQAVLVTPPFNIIAAGLASEGNAIGAILASTLPVLALFILRWPLFNYGYKQGANVINDVAGAGMIDKLQIGANILGVTVMGGFVPSMIGATLPVKLGKDLTIDGATVEAKTLQQVLDAIFPYLVPLGLTFGCYYLIKVRKMSPLSVILVLFVVAFLLGALGWMA